MTTSATARDENELDNFCTKGVEALTPLLLPLSTLQAAYVLDDFAEELRALSANYVRDARREGVTWESIGRAFGVTRSAVCQRFGG